jgi:hypothetical protein
MSKDVQALLVAVSALTCLGLVIGLWERHWLYRCLPVAYGLCYGFGVAIQFGHTGLELIENLFVGTAFGLLILLCAWGEVWVERRRNPQKRTPIPGRHWNDRLHSD